MDCAEGSVSQRLPCFVTAEAINEYLRLSASTILELGCLSMAPYAEEGCKLFVYGVNENTSNSELSDAFSKYGTVVDTYNTGKGYAFVTFDNKEDAQTATDQLNGQEILGQQVVPQLEYWYRKITESLVGHPFQCFVGEGECSKAQE